jgi:hypothetical protein
MIFICAISFEFEAQPGHHGMTGRFDNKPFTTTMNLWWTAGVKRTKQKPNMHCKWLQAEQILKSAISYLCYHCKLCNNVKNVKLSLHC